MKCCWLVSLLLLTGEHVFAWGFWAHKRINHIAVFTLPAEMQYLFKPNIDFVTEHAVDPDKRRYSTEKEAPRHYIDLEHFCTMPCNDVPLFWKDAVTKYTEDSLNAYGIVPWHVQLMMYRLEDAFRTKNKERILRTAADLGHYIADAHVPLHTTENYNGQLTNQVGIHAFWESRIPELHGEKYDYLTGKASYIEKPAKRIWQVVMQSHKALDTVLGFEKKVSNTLPQDQLYTIEMRGNTTVRIQSETFTKVYSDMMDGMVERRMREAIGMVGDAWYTCWVNAGMPDLKNTDESPLPVEEQQQLQADEKKWSERKQQFGHPHSETGTETPK